MAVVAVAAVVADRSAPQTGATVLAWSAMAVALASAANLGLFTVKAVAQIPSVADHLGWSYRTVIDDTAHVSWAPWASAVLLAGAVVGAARVWRRHRRGQGVAAEMDGVPDDQQVVLVESDAVDAFAVPGGTGRVVVTTAMRSALDTEQFEALVAHERAHLDAGHPRLILIAELAGSLHPALRWVAARVSFLIERAADEQAARAVGDRRTVATAIGAAALAAARHPASSAPVRIPFAARRGGAIPRRVGELLAPQQIRGRTWGWVWGAGPVLLAASSVVWSGEALYDLVELLRSARLPGR
ncbi:M56 family metallopeptidase [Spirillospora sp. CA-108201]